MTTHAHHDPDEVLTTEQLVDWTKIGNRFWEKLRISGGGPRYLYLSRRAVRYRRGDVQEWLDTRGRKSTSDSSPGLHRGSGSDLSRRIEK